MYSRYAGPSGNRKVRHWNDDRKYDFAGCKKEEDAESLFKKGMAALMQGKLKKAKNEFNLCLSHNLAHRQAPGHIEVADFYEKSQQAADDAIKSLHKSGKAHCFSAGGVWKAEFTQKDADEMRSGFDQKSAAAEFGMGRAYLALAIKLGRDEWKEFARVEFDRALSLLGKTKAEKYMAAAVHRICAQAEDSGMHLAKMRELDPHIPDDW